MKISNNGSISLNWFEHIKETDIIYIIHLQLKKMDENLTETTRNHSDETH